MIVAIGALGLPVGTETYKAAAAWAALHPVRVVTDPVLFWAVLIIFSVVWGRYLDRKDARRAAKEKR